MIFIKNKFIFGDLHQDIKTKERIIRWIHHKIIVIKHVWKCQNTWFYRVGKLKIIHMTFEEWEEYFKEFLTRD